MSSSSMTPLHLLSFPYINLSPIHGGKQQLWVDGRKPGSVLVWQVQPVVDDRELDVVRHRPGGLPLILVLPPISDTSSDGKIVQLVEVTRPHGILPFHEELSAGELTAILRHPPDSLAVEFTDYLAWRGIPIDRETRQLIRKTVELSSEIRTISGLSRSLYMSRRALGRRFMSRGLPVPSHWLHIARLLRVAIHLQNSEESVLSVGYDLGYPDGFSLSNQLMRLTGFRPVDVRRCLGWEWLVEAWLRREADSGGLAPELTEDILCEPPHSPSASERSSVDKRSGTRHSPTSPDRKRVG